MNGVFTFPYDSTTYYFTFANSNPVDFKLYVQPVNYNNFAATYFAAPYFSFTKSWFYLDSTLPISISTNSGPYFYETLQLQGVEGLLSYNVQTHPIDLAHPIVSEPAPINFNSSYGLYFWEIFFYIPYLVAERYLINRKYNDSLSWYGYIFSSKGYRSTDGQLDTTSTGEVRYWNVVPLQEDDSWNTAIPPTTDANLIGMNDPMVFKLTIFLRNVNALIEQGDDYYRQLQREKLARAKICYLQAERLLGQKPQINVNSSWRNPTLGDESNAPSADVPEATSNLLQAFIGYVAGEYGNFKPPYNEELLSYWDKLEQRFYNLRHNLSLQGQPLSLPTYATPVSPMELQMRQNMGNGPGGNTVLPIPLNSQYRFVALLEKARTAVNSVTQFGSELLSLLEKNDNESLTLLLQEQQQKITELTEGIQDINTAMQKDTLTGLEEAEKSAAARAEFYHALIKNGLSTEENASINEQKEAADQIQIAGVYYLTAAAANLAPNIFGTSFGGIQWGAMFAATGLTFQLQSQALQSTANVNSMSASYDRRSQEWSQQEKNAQGEVAQLGAQIAAAKQSIAMSEKQSALYAQELKNQKAVHQQQITRFTGLTLYGWLVSRLSSLYYQLYSATLPLCLATKQALYDELGNPLNANYFAAPAWDNLYKGLLAGQGLQLELQRMENAYLEQNRRGLEIQRSVSLNDLIVSGDPLKTFSSVVAEAYQSPNISTLPVNGVSLKYNSTVEALLVILEISDLDLESACNSNDRKGRFATISVTLPTLLGPYQTVDATLNMGTTTVALSRGLDDPGIFVLDFNDPRYLPFEGLPVTSGLLTLSFYQANPATTTPPAPPGRQWALVQNLVDVIYQMRYTLKDN
ncbi:hypothetical protein [Pseudomonas chlororaphis]|nr:hypothetical protein [Pseudomonas chlororaphis]